MYVLIEYGADDNRYIAYADLTDAQEDFIKRARRIGEEINDPEILANDQDDMEVLAEGMIYSPNTELRLEIVEANNGGILDRQAKEDLMALANSSIDKNAFVSTLQCVGCYDEFSDYRSSIEE